MASLGDSETRCRRVLEIDMANSDEGLHEFRAALDALYGPGLERAALFGSRARGDARAGSDYDFAVFLRDYQDRWVESDRVVDAANAVLISSGAFTHAMPYRAAQDDERSPVMHEILRDGRNL